MVKNLSELTAEEKRDLETRVKSEYLEAKNHFLYYHKDRYDRYYKNFRDNGDDRLEELRNMGGEKWMSNLFVPLTSSQIRTAAAKVNVRKPKWMLYADHEDDQAKVEDVNDLMA
jgi:hypothetical protein